jgi:hypothetical protein
MALIDIMELYGIFFKKVETTNQICINIYELPSGNLTVCD